MTILGRHLAMHAVLAVARIFLLEAFIHYFLWYYRSRVPKLQVAFFLNNQIDALIIQFLFSVIKL
jgi:hypothetical protein